jgi:hypothetical protein
MNLRKWADWGFAAREIYRTPRYNFLVQPVRSGLAETEGDDPAFVLTGRWYRVGDDIERKLEKISWAVYFFALVLVVVMIRSAVSGGGVLAAIAFVIVYITIEGFMPLALGVLASRGFSARVEIPWRSLEKVMLLTDHGVMLLGWSEGGAGRAVALRLHPDTARKVADRLKNALPAGVSISEVSGVSLGNPPRSA